MSADDRVASPGRVIVQTSWWGTAVLTISAVAGAASPSLFAPVAFAVAVGLFVLGLGAFVWAYALAVSRSRNDELSLSGLFLLSGSGDPSARRHLLGSLAIEVVVALATAGARPFTSLAFGVLAPMFGLALVGLWGARHGTFPPRSPREARRRERPAR